MKAVLISIQPVWCELIARGQKTVEVRKSKPKLEPPFKCYIYMTTGNASIPNGKGMVHHYSGGKCVIGEFVCDGIYRITTGIDAIGDKHVKSLIPLEYRTCLSDDDLFDYLFKGIGNYDGYGWHISNLVVYDNPKLLNAFFRECPGLDNTGMCYECENANGEECDCVVDGRLHIIRPPQSWCYVEEVRA